MFGVRLLCEVKYLVALPIGQWFLFLHLPDRAWCGLCFWIYSLWHLYVNNVFGSNVNKSHITWKCHFRQDKYVYIIRCKSWEDWCGLLACDRISSFLSVHVTIFSYTRYLSNIRVAFCWFLSTSPKSGLNWRHATDQRVTMLVKKDQRTDRRYVLPIFIVRLFQVYSLGNTSFIYFVFWNTDCLTTRGKADYICTVCCKSRLMTCVQLLDPWRHQGQHDIRVILLLVKI